LGGGLISSAIWNALLPKREPKDRSKQIKTLIGSFRYPRKGPGMMWESAAQRTVISGEVMSRKPLV
jgi:hypothetical protein